MTETRIEHIGGDFGVTVIYTLDQYRKTSIKFFATEIVATDVAGTTRYYERAGWTVSGDHVEEPAEGERYVAGTVKWDGCSHYDFGDKNGYIHLCGANDVAKLAATITGIHTRCAELMRESGGDPIANAFKERP